jgi:hypothetical protein
MRQQHKTHLVSTYATVLQHLEEVRQAVVAGKSPGGGRLTPLSPPARDPLIDSLDAIAARLEDAVRAFTPDLEDALGRTGGEAATRMWVSILLRTIRELVEDLQPARISRRYGDLSSADSRRLDAGVQQVLSEIDRSLSLLG